MIEKKVIITSKVAAAQWFWLPRCCGFLSRWLLGLFDFSAFLYLYFSVLCTWTRLSNWWNPITTFFIKRCSAVQLGINQPTFLSTELDKTLLKLPFFIQSHLFNVLPSRSTIDPKSGWLDSLQVAWNETSYHRYHAASSFYICQCSIGSA